MIANRLRYWIPVVILLAVTAAVYWQVGGHGFVAFDDGVYITTNRHVPNGLTWDNVKYAMTTGETGTWQPLTLLTHMLDCQVFGLWPGGHHFTNLALHLLNTLLLFLALRRLTGGYGPSLFAAAVFALHPLHVESVAWVSERKDVLSTLFWMLTLLAYADYARTRRLASYGLVAVLLTLGLMAKPMLVTLPCVLLLLDVWPLGRIGTQEHPWRLSPAISLAAEKLPLFLLSAASSCLTLYTQRATESVIDLAKLPVGLRVSNALVSYVRYLDMTVWPTNLAVFYPFPARDIPSIYVWGAVILLAALTCGALFLLRSAPYVAVGWFWYLGTLAPVIGFVQVGAQAMADRYTYVPMIGLSIIPAWGIPQWLNRRCAPKTIADPQRIRAILWAASVGLCVVLAWRTYIQAGYWKDTELLFRHAAEVTADNALANANAGMALNDKGRYAAAIPFLEEALRIRPGDGFALFHMGVALQNLGRIEEAAAFYRRCLNANPRNLEAMNNLGLCLLGLGRAGEAVSVLGEALRIQPEFAEAAGNYGAALLQLGRVAEAYDFLSKRAPRHPESASLHINLGIAYAATSRREEAIREFEHVLRFHPENVQARKNLEILRGQGNAPSP